MNARVALQTLGAPPIRRARCTRQCNTSRVQVLIRTPQLRHLDLSTSAFAMPTLWKVLNRFFLPHLETLSLKVCRLVFEGAHTGPAEAIAVPIPQAAPVQPPLHDGGTHHSVQASTVPLAVGHAAVVTPASCCMMRPCLVWNGVVEIATCMGWLAIVAPRTCDRGCFRKVMLQHASGCMLYLLH